MTDNKYIYALLEDGTIEPLPEWCKETNEQKKGKKKTIKLKELTDILENAIKNTKDLLTYGGRVCGSNYSYGKIDAYKEVLKIIEALKEQNK